MAAVPWTPPCPAGAALYMQQRMSGISLLNPSDAHGRTGNGDNGLVASTALCVWPCSRALAAALLEPPHVVDCRGLAVLELGAGCALPGLAAWRAGASVVWLTELPENVAQLREIAQRNGSPTTVRVEALDWTQPLPREVAQTRFDLVLGADLVFWPALFDSLLSVLEALHGSPQILLATCSNRLGRGDDFELRAMSRGWTLQEVMLPNSASPKQGFDLYDFSPRLIEMARGAGGNASRGVKVER